MKERDVVASFIPQGVCSRQIDFEIDDVGLVRDVRFTKGCAGNALGVATLVEGRPATEIIALLKGLPCDNKPTSCPDQLAKALAAELEARS
ncbi:MAG: TIGR03905 family TSCPD domain-containing protein [Coriobacteriales bacterium]|nr:TIGR03905 family TSCPD domain-containing protein [Coriobacteriales bacterium]